LRLAKAGEKAETLKRRRRKVKSKPKGGFNGFMTPVG